MKQPTKDTLREQLALADDEIIRLRDENQVLRDGGALWRRSFEWTVADRKPWCSHSAAWIVHNNDEIGVPLTMDYMEIDVEVVVGDRKPWWRRLWDKCKAVLGRG